MKKKTTIEDLLKRIEELEARPMFPACPLPHYPVPNYPQPGQGLPQFPIPPYWTSGANGATNEDPNKKLC